MSTTRTVRADQPGPIIIRTDLGCYDLLVLAEDGRRVGELTVSTADDSGTSADAVNNAELTARGDTLFAGVEASNQGSTIIQTGRGHQSVMFNSGGGTFIAGDMFVNGQRVTAGNGSTVIVGGSGITITARVPLGSSVQAHSLSGDIETTGPLLAVDASTVSGDVSVESTMLAKVRTTSGDIRIDALGREAEANSVSGDISIAGPAGALARARTTSGDIRGAGASTSRDVPCRDG